jgi:transcriptional regulator with XRE-family HTH domain
MVRKLEGFGTLEGFDIEAYRRRLKIMREIVSGDNQSEFANRLGIDFKRWSNYERGYPVPREVAFLLHKKFPGISIEWIWFGSKTSLSADYRRRIETAEKMDAEERDTLAEMAKIKKKLDESSARRKKALHPVQPAKRSRS